jgi:hypothetical protein
VKKRLLTIIGAVVVLALAATAYTVHARDRQPTTNALPVVSGPLALGGLMFRNTAAGPDTGKVAAQGEPRKVGGLSCDRFYAAGGTAACLAAQPGVLPPMTDLVVLDANLNERERHELPGIPNRLRVSPSGRMVSWTVFVAGDSYATTDFSTRTGILDTKSGDLRTSIEDIFLEVDGKRYYASDLNFWGVTFTADDKLFYATVGTAGRTHLVKVDYDQWEAKALRVNAECPSLSPDETRVAFKKRVSAGVWRLTVLNLATGEETALAETRSVDDQAVWLDKDTVGYGLAGDVWSVPADGTGAPKLLIPSAASPVPVA